MSSRENSQGAAQPEGPRAPLLPPTLTVLVRDWLSANHVLLRSPEGVVMVDTGYSRRIDMTRALLGSAQGLRGMPLATIVNTHCHSDHMGGNARLAREHGCPVLVPEGEADAIAAWDERALLLGYAGQWADRFEADGVLRAGEVHRWGELDWEMLAAPGHDMGALCFFNREHGILISGDALWANGFGFLMPVEFDPRAMPATRATLQMLAELPIRVVIPGHGAPFTDVQAALARAFSRLDAWEANPSRLARHALKVMLMFCLLDLRELREEGLPAFIEGIELFREFNARCLGGSPPGDLAATLLGDLRRAGAVSIEAGRVRPSVPAG